MLAALALLLSPAAAAAAPVQTADREYSIARTGVFSLRSADGHDYRVMAAWPEGSPPPSGWPVLYVLDGEDNFAIVTQTLRRLARAGARSGVEDGIVVAIESGGLARRVRDYTPKTPGWTIPAGAPAAGLTTGGADAFLDFVETRVKPAIASRWRVDADRQMLLGYSFGGLLGLHALLTRPAMFDTIVAISPSLWFGGDLVVRQAAAFRPTGTEDRRLLVAMGSEERAPGRAAPVSVEQFVQQLRSTARSVEVEFLPLPGQGHGATMLAGLPAALGFAMGRGAK